MNKSSRDDWIKWQKKVIREEYLSSKKKTEKEISFNHKKRA